jgi:hypothetical protein
MAPRPPKCLCVDTCVCVCNTQHTAYTDDQQEQHAIAPTHICFADLGRSKVQGTLNLAIRFGQRITVTRASAHSTAATNAARKELGERE